MKKFKIYAYDYYSPRTNRTSFSITAKTMAEASSIASLLMRPLWGTASVITVRKYREKKWIQCLTYITHRVYIYLGTQHADMQMCNYERDIQPNNHSLRCSNHYQHDD